MIISVGEVAAALVPTPAVEDPAVSPGAKKKSPTSREPITSSVEVQKVLEETANFARYCRLLLDEGKDVLVVVFEGSLKQQMRVGHNSFVFTADLHAGIH